MEILGYLTDIHEIYGNLLEINKNPWIFSKIHCKSMEIHSKFEDILDIFVNH